MQMNKPITTSILALALGLTAGAAQAANLTVLARLGSQHDALTFGPDGQLYGAASGGPNGYGFVFKISTSGALTTLANLDPATSGLGSPGGLVFDSTGNIFGTASDSRNVGAKATIFKLTPTGTLSRVATLGTNTYPSDGLTIDASGTLYGVTPFAQSQYGSYGSVFKVTSAGVATTLATFNNTNGAYPAAQVTLDAAGNIYGTTQNGGLGFNQYNNGYGTVFKISTTGVFTTLTDSLPGANPRGKLAIDGSGNIFGTTSGGYIWKMSSAGAFTTLARFNGSNGLGVGPAGGLLLDAAGNLFGTTVGGGDTVLGPNTGVGTVFEYTAAGVLKTLATFNNDNGYSPEAGLTADAAGNLYGTTRSTIFKLGDTGFVPFAAGVPEPANWALLLTGFGMTGAVMRRRSLRNTADRGELRYEASRG